MFSVKSSVLAVATGALAVIFAQTAQASPFTDELEILPNIDEVPPEMFSVFNTTEAEGNVLQARSGCYQGKCPDFSASFDLMVIHGNLGYLRIKHKGDGCDVCVSKRLDRPGCTTFSLCGKKWDVCVDASKFRAHRVIGGVKTCWTLRQHNLGTCEVDGKHVKPTIFTAWDKVKCTW